MLRLSAAAGLSARAGSWLFARRNENATLRYPGQRFPAARGFVLFVAFELGSLC